MVLIYFYQNSSTHKITDFVSFYSLPSTIMHSPQHNLLNAAYLYYYATDVALETNALENGTLKKRLEELIGDALIIADQAKFDVFNALSLMDNVEFLSSLKVSHIVVVLEESLGLLLNHSSVQETVF